MIGGTFCFFLLTILLTVVVADNAAGQIPDFVRRAGTQLTYQNRPFYAIGVNSYFLQHITAYGDTSHVHEVFKEAEMMGLTTIRTWGFHDARDSSNRAAMQWGPGEYNEAGLQALDFVVALARRYGIYLIVPLVNNWDDYGGMNAYVRWYAGRYPLAAQATAATEQRFVYGPAGRSYAVHAAGALTHDDFYRLPQIKQWYKAYVSMLLRRVNSVTGIAYKDDPTILMWELANEPRSSDASGNLVYNWIAEMSAFIKSIDPNHLVATGEEGHDTEQWPYSDIARYNDQSWLFDGAAGISYSRNIKLPDIDVATVHCYPEAWGLTFNQGLLWFRDHRRLAHSANKPVLFEEVGAKRHVAQFFEMLFGDIYYGNSAGILPWQFAYDERPNNDGYAFYYPQDTRICEVIQTYARRFKDKTLGVFPLPGSSSLLHSYPNPFNEVATIAYTLSDQSFVRLLIYNTLGQRIATLVEEEQSPGVYHTLFQAGCHASGPYFVFLETPRSLESSKIMLTK